MHIPHAALQTCAPSLHGLLLQPHSTRALLTMALLTMTLLTMLPAVLTMALLTMAVLAMALLTIAVLTVAVITMALLTMALLTVALLAVALLTMALLTMALLTMALLTMAVLTVALLTVALLTMALLAMLYAVLGLALLSTPYYSGSSLQPHTASLQPSLQPHAVNLQQYCTSKSKPKPEPISLTQAPLALLWPSYLTCCHTVDSSSISLSVCLMLSRRACRDARLSFIAAWMRSMPFVKTLVRRERTSFTRCAAHARSSDACTCLTSIPDLRSRKSTDS